MIIEKTDVKKAEKKTPTIPLPFVNAINFELTYSCSYSCPHCLQEGIRKAGKNIWINTEAAVKAVQDAWYAGILTAVNFTGGEIFMPESNLPELLEAAFDHFLIVRVNTNGWWGDKTDIKIGRENFRDSEAVVKWLIENNVAALALSYDERYKTNRKALDSFISVLKQCSKHGLNCQIVCSGENYINNNDLNILNEKYDLDLDPASFLEIDSIDIGGSSYTNDKKLNCDIFYNLKEISDCRLKGLHRPAVLHINPAGGVRSCMYAPGSAALGNINNESIHKIINNYIHNPVVSMFRNNSFEDFIREYIEPFAWKYREIKHPCAACAVLTRLKEEIEENSSSVESIHDRIISEYNLFP